MAKSRKTADISAIKEEANRVLKGTWPGNTKEFRLGVIVMLENILWAADNYRGYRYLSNHELPGHIEPGVRYRADGSSYDYDERFLNTDNTRRVY
jgi:hypothetical protein